MRDARERFEKAQELDYDGSIKELQKIEAELETANRLELGISQSLLMQVLKAEYEAHYYGYGVLVEEYNRVKRSTAKLRELKADLAAREAQLREIEEELGYRHSQLSGLKLHLKRLVARRFVIRNFNGHKEPHKSVPPTRGH